MNTEILCGRQPVIETLKAGRRRLIRAFIADNIKASPETGQIDALLAGAGIQPVSVKREKLDEITENANHQGYAIEVPGYPYADHKEILERLKDTGKALVLVLDHIQDPQNLGSILRTAECAGVDAVIIPEDRAVQITPAVVRASAGASEHMAVCKVANIVQSMERFKKADFWFYGLESVEAAKPVSEVKYSAKSGIVIGSEGEGLSRLVLENCDFLIRLPVRGKISSLNAGVAAGIAIYGFVSQSDQAQNK